MINKKTILLTSLLALAMSFSASANKPIYKWTDSDGNIKYTQSKPPRGTDYDVIYQRTGNSSNSTKESKENTSADESENIKVDANTTNEEINQANCKIAQRNLDTLKNRAKVFKEVDGEKKLLSDKERNDRLEQTKENVSKYCK